MFVNKVKTLQIFISIYFLIKEGQMCGELKI